MANVRCPECKNLVLGVPPEFQDTIQCDRCAVILRVVTRNDRPVDVRLRKTDLAAPEGLPKDLEQVFAEAIDVSKLAAMPPPLMLFWLFVKKAYWEKQELRESDSSI